MFKKIINPSNLLVIIISTFLVVLIVYAFTEPTQSPPGGNVPAPLNVGPAAQIKAGGLILNTGGATSGLIVDKGNVGIGTREPSAKLSVLGNIALLINPLTTYSPGPELSLQSWTYNTVTQRSDEVQISERDWDREDDGTPDHDKYNRYTCPPGSGGNSYNNDLYMYSGGKGPFYYRINTVTCITQPYKYSIRTDVGTLQFLNNNNEIKMVIDQAGNVGIGTTTPNATLDVNGSLKAKRILTPAPGSYICIGGLVWNDHAGGSVQCVAPVDGYYRGIDFYLGGAAVSDRVWANAGQTLKIQGYWDGSGDHGCYEFFYVDGVAQINGWGDNGCKNSLSNYAIIFSPDQ